MTGPVQILVIGLDEPTFSGEVMAEFGRLREAGTVRLLDVVLIRRAADGTLETLPLPASAPAGMGQLAARLLGAPHVEPPVVDTQLSGTAASELRPHIACPDVVVPQVMELHVLERHAVRPQEAASGGFIHRVLHGKTHGCVPVHGRDHLAHGLGRRETRLVFERRPEHPHGVVAFVLAGKPPTAAFLTIRCRPLAAGGQQHPERDDQTCECPHGALPPLE